MKNIIKREDRSKNIGHFELGGFIVNFYADERKVENCYAMITTVSKNFSLRVTGYAFGYLMASVKDGNTDNLHGYCAMMYLISDGVYQDPAFAQDLMGAVMKYQDRLLKQAEKEAKAVTEAEEMVNQALMDDVVKRTTMSKKEARKASAEDKAILREIIDEGKNAADESKDK